MLGMMPRLSPVLLKAVLLLLVLAWGTALASDPLVAQSVEPLFEHPIEVTVSATSATIVVTTSEPLACVVVYGEDETFGHLALDQEMGGAAHREHRVVLRGLAPDTEYVYRFQGSAADGTFYASELYTFRTEPGDEVEALGVNVAQLERGARIVEASSEFSAAFAAQHAIDGDPATEWSSAGDGDDAFITVELAEAAEVVGFGFWTRTMGLSAQVYSFTVENEAGEHFGPFELPDADRLHAFPIEASGQRFTFRVVSSSSGNTGAVELAVFARE